MCVIAVKNEGSEISEELFKKMWERNSDGAGFVARKNKNSKWEYQKGLMDYDKAREIILPYLSKEAEIILHLRIKSKGNITAELTHPFEFSRNNKEQRFIFHNGTISPLSGWGDCSDSSTLAELIKPINTKSVYKVLEGFVEKKHGRFVTFVLKDGKDAEIKIFGDDESKEVDGVWFSNLRHLQEKVVVTQSDHYWNRGPRHYNHNNPVEVNGKPVTSVFVKTPEVNKIIDFYLKLKKWENTEVNRNKIYEHYSLSLMCQKFIDCICKKIDSGEVEDPILSFFEL